MRAFAIKMELGEMDLDCCYTLFRLMGTENLWYISTEGELANLNVDSGPSLYTLTQKDADLYGVWYDGFLLVDQIVEMVGERIDDPDYNYNAGWIGTWHGRKWLREEDAGCHNLISDRPFFVEFTAPELVLI